jgi:hypothetical protein
MDGTSATLPRNPVHLLGVKPKESLDSSFVLSSIRIVIWTIWTMLFSALASQLLDRSVFAVNLPATPAYEADFSTSTPLLLS